MKNYIIVNEFFCHETFNKVYLELQKAFNSLGEELQVLTNVQARKLINKKGNNAPVLFYDKDVYLAKLLEKSGYRCVNGSFAIETCDDKAKTYLALKDKVPMPKTYLAPFCYDGYLYTNTDFLRGIYQTLGFPLIVKENKGSFGAQVYLVNDKSELVDLINNFGHSEFLFQKFIDESCGKDIRVYVVGGKVVASAMRYNDKDFRSNVTNGGHMQKIELSKEYEEVALTAVKEVGADFAGVDLLITKEGPLVCEVNSNAHFNELSRVSGVSVAQEIAKYFLSLKK